MDKPCKDCVAEGVTSDRPAPWPGPRCMTHHRVVTRARKAAAHANRLAKVYGITRETYEALLALQGGRCAICTRATGATRRLSVDHDHAQAVLDGHEPTNGCPVCIRGLLCRPCNDVLGHLRDSAAAGVRIALYLTDPPARQLARQENAR